MHYNPSSRPWNPCSILFFSCCAWVACASPGDAEEVRKIALLVGVADYQDGEIDDLQYAENDVRAVSGQLRLMGFDVTSVTGKEATRETVDAMIDQFLDNASRLESSDVALVMFSGHGQQLRATNTVGGVRQLAEVPYFCPYDVNSLADAQHSVRGLDDAAIANKLNLVSLNRVIAGLDEQSNSLNNLLIVDACRNNPAKGKAAGVSGTSARIPRGVNILFAAKSGQKSWESADPEIENGVFTHYLIKALQGEAKNSRDQVTWSRLASYLQDEVAYAGWELAGAESRVQNPHSIINSDGLIVLGEALTEKLIIERLYQSVTHHEALLEMASRCHDREFIVAPLWAGLWTASPRHIDRTIELLRPWYDSDLLLGLVANEKGAIVEELQSRELGAGVAGVHLSIANEIYNQLQLSQETQKSRLLQDCLDRTNSELLKLVCRVRLLQMNEQRDDDAPVLFQYSPGDRLYQRKEIENDLNAIRNDDGMKLDEWEQATVAALLNELKSSDKDIRRRRMIGKKIPLLEGSDLAGDPINIRDSEGKIVLLDVWAFW